MAGNNTNSQEVRDKANAAAQRAKQMSPSIQYAIVQILPNILNGAFWGFTNMADIKDHVEAIRNSGGSMVVRKLNNDACLIEADPNFLVKHVIQIDPNAVTQKDLDEMVKARAEAQISLEKFLIKMAKSSEKTGQQFAGTIGIYCTNDVNTIMYRCKTYPAFRTDIVCTLALLRQYGYSIRINGNFISPDEAAKADQALWSSMQLSPTKTGLFIDVRCNISAAQAKELEKQFKVKYSVK